MGNKRTIQLSHIEKSWEKMKGIFYCLCFGLLLNDVYGKSLADAEEVAEEEAEQVAEVAEETEEGGNEGEVDEVGRAAEEEVTGAVGASELVEELRKLLEKADSERAANRMKIENLSASANDIAEIKKDVHFLRETLSTARDCCKTAKCLEYRGDIAFTENGKTCLPWSEAGKDEEIAKYPNAGIAKFRDAKNPTTWVPG